MIETKESLLQKIAIGQTVDIATSEYSLTPIEGQWKPQYRANKATIESLIKSGHFTGATFFRGATITRVR